MNTAGRCDWCKKWASDHRRLVRDRSYNGWFCQTCFYAYITNDKQFSDADNGLVSCMNLDCKVFLSTSAVQCWKCGEKQ